MKKFLSVKIGDRGSQLNFVNSTNEVFSQTEERVRSRKCNFLEPVQGGHAQPIFAAAQA